MPAKSKHGRGKHPHNSKRNKIRQRQAVAGLQPQAAQDVAKPAVPVRASVSPAAKATSTVAASTTVERSYILGEIKRIGILTGITIIILVILALILK
jgi:hypothetical protein